MVSVWIYCNTLDDSAWNEGSSSNLGASLQYLAQRCCRLMRRHISMDSQLIDICSYLRDIHAHEKVVGNLPQCCFCSMRVSRLIQFSPEVKSQHAKMILIRGLCAGRFLQIRHKKSTKYYCWCVVKWSWISLELKHYRGCFNSWERSCYECGHIVFDFVLYSVFWMHDVWLVEWMNVCMYVK